MIKNILAASAATLFMVACNDTKTDKTTVESTQDSANNMVTTPPATSATTYTPVEGDVKFYENKVMVMRNGSWVEAESDVKLDDGVVVYKTGKVERGDYVIELRDGEVVNRTGNFFDRTGAAIENAWDATKEGAKDAGRAVKKGVLKVGDKIEGALDGDKKGENKDQ